MALSLFYSDTPDEAPRMSQASVPP